MGLCSLCCNSRPPLGATTASSNVPVSPVLSPGALHPLSSTESTRNMEESHPPSHRALLAPTCSIFTAFLLPSSKGLGLNAAPGGAEEEKLPMAVASHSSTNQRSSNRIRLRPKDVAWFGATLTPTTRNVQNLQIGEGEKHHLSFAEL